MNRIVQLEDICITLEEAQALNNTENCAHAWVYNPHKHFPEYELMAVSSVVKIDGDDFSSLPMMRIKKGKWELYATDVFVAMEQVQALIKQGIFYFAPLKRTEPPQAYLHRQHAFPEALAGPKELKAKKKAVRKKK